MEEPYRIVLVDSNISFRYGMKRILMQNADLTVAEEASDGLELFDLLKLSKTAPEMLIIDIFMPYFDGIQTVRQIKKIYPKIKILIMSMHKEKQYHQKVFSLGADGYLLKQDLEIEIIAAIEKIKQGGVYLSPLLAME